jgi:hypothetical protein
LTGDRVVVVAVVLDEGRSVAVGVDVVGVDLGGQQSRLNKLRIPSDDGFIFFEHRGGWWRNRKNAWCWWRERVREGIGWLPFCWEVHPRCQQWQQLVLLWH